MKIGVFTLSTDASINPIALALAQALEERHFDSLFVGERTHVLVSSAVSRTTRSALRGPVLPEHYRMLDPFVILSAAAAVTQYLTLGTSVAVIPVRDPIVLAKQIATLDLIFGGRVVLGVGAGQADEILTYG